MNRCRACGAELDDPTERYCGGGHCAQVFVSPPVGSIGYTGTYREYPEDVVSRSVVSVLEARGPE